MSPKMSPLQALAAAGRELKLFPETFAASMGEMKGAVVNMETKEEVTAPPQRVIDYNGQIVALPGQSTYKTTITIIWDKASADNAVENLKKQLVNHEVRLRTQMEYSNLESLEYFWENREV